MIELLTRIFRWKGRRYIEAPYDEYYKIAELTMKVIGLWKSSENHNLNYFIIIPIISFIVVGSIGMILAIHESIQDLKLTADNILYFILLIHTLNAYLCMIYLVERINRILEAVKSKFRNFESEMTGEESRLKTLSQGGALRFIKLVTLIVYSVHVTYFISSKCYLPNSETKTLFFNIVLPFRSNSNFYYYYAFTFEMIISIIEGVINLASVTITVGFLYILCYEIDIFGIILENIKKIDPKQSKEAQQKLCPFQSELSCRLYAGSILNTQLYEESSKHIVERIVEHHVYIISLMNDVQTILSFIVLDMFVTCEFMLCLCSFQIYQIYSTTTFVSLMKNICMLAALIVHEFVYFFFGQRLVSKTQDLHRSVYFCEWYNETKSFKSSMNIIHIRMNKPFTILAGKIVPVTLASFITCLKAAFSYFNLLRALSHT